MAPHVRDVTARDLTARDVSDLLDLTTGPGVVTGPADSPARPAAVEAVRRAATPSVTVVLPTLNEGKNIGWVLERLPTPIHEVIVVDGRSTDDTVEVARGARPDVRVVEQKLPGKGAALALGLSAATGDITVMMDADGSMDPAEIPGLVGALVAGADVVKGSRASSGGGSHDLSLLRRSGNLGLTTIANLLYRQRWRELCYGYAAFWSDVIPTLGLDAVISPPVQMVRARRGRGLGYGHGFEIEALLFCRAARAGLRVAEVFSFEHARRHGQSNLLTWRDGSRVLRAIVREQRWVATGGTPDRHVRCYPVVPHLFADTSAKPGIPAPRPQRDA